MIGAWNEILEAAIDINDALEKFTQGTLHISAGLGLYPEKYPVRALARQTGELEDWAKGIDGKNAIALFDESNVYKWLSLIHIFSGGTEPADRLCGPGDFFV